MSSTLSESRSDDGRAWYWAPATVLGALPGFVIGFQNIPAPIEGVPFVQVLPALVLGGFGAAAVDLLRVAVDPDRHEQAFVKVAGAMLIVIVASWMADVRNYFTRGDR